RPWPSVARTTKNRSSTHPSRAGPAPNQLNPLLRPFGYTSVAEITFPLRYNSVAKIGPIMLYLPKWSAEMSGVGRRAHRDSAAGALLGPTGRGGDPPGGVPPAPDPQPRAGPAHAPGQLRLEGGPHPGPLAPAPPRRPRRQPEGPRQPRPP